MEIKRSTDSSNRVRWSTFLREIFDCSLGAYGGHEVHQGVFTVKKKW